MVIFHSFVYVYQKRVILGRFDPPQERPISMIPSAIPHASQATSLPSYARKYRAETNVALLRSFGVGRPWCPKDYPLVN